MNVFGKIILVSTVPLLVAIGLSGIMVTTELEQYQRTSRTEQIVRSSPTVSAVIHEMQRERGQTAAYLSSDATTPPSALLAQRDSTDAALSAFMSEIVQLNQVTSTAVHDSFVRFGRDVEATLAMRDRINTKVVPVSEMAGEYTAKIVDGLELITALNQGSDDIQRVAEATRHLLFAKEAMGLERAMGARIFNSGIVSPDLFGRYFGLRELQDFHINAFLEHGSTEDAKRLQSILDEFATSRLSSMRETIVEGGLTGDLGETTSQQWFAAISEQIDAIRSLELVMDEELLGEVSHKKGQLRSLLIATLGIIGAAIVFAGFLSVYVGRQLLAGPIVELSRVCSQLADDKIVKIPHMERKDEIGGMARSMSDVYEASVARKRIRAALRNTSAQLMIVTRGEIMYTHPNLVSSVVDATGDPKMGELFSIGKRLENIETLSKAISSVERMAPNNYIGGFPFGNKRFDLHVATAMDEDGEDLGMVIEWRDVTDRRQAEESLADLLTNAAQGDFSDRVMVDTSDPLLRSMTDGINTVCETVETFIHDLSATLAALSKGDLTRPVTGHYAGQLESLAADARSTIFSLTDLVTVIRGSGHTLDQRAQALRSDAGQLAQRTESQAAAIEETSATMEEITRAVTETAKNAREVNDLVVETQSQVSACHVTMTETVSAIRQIEDGSTAISEIISIIQSIAFQTNLLALNAAVEAARAGSAGAGFAVVASEVRALAQRSSDAAKEIDAKIQSSVEDVGRGVRLVEEAGSSLVEIKTSVDQSVVTINKITRANVDQADSVKEIQVTINEMDRITQENAIIAEKSARVSGEISDNSADLKQKTDQFKLKGAAEPKSRTAA